MRFCCKNSKLLFWVMMSVAVSITATVIATLFVKQQEKHALDEKDADIKECGC